MPAKPESRKDLGVALRFLRSLRGWDQETLAGASGAKLKSLKAIEQGVRGASPKTLGPVLASLGFSLQTLAEVRSFIRRLRTQAVSAAAPDLRRELLALLLPPAPVRRAGGPSALEASRREAPALWARFQTCSKEGQLDVAREAAEFHTAGFVELLCEESRNAACDSASRALHLASCAAAVASAVRGEEGWRSRLAGYAGVHRANALRVGGDLISSDRAFSRTGELWRAGAASDPGLLNAARVLHLEASLRREQRRLHEALALLDQALEIDRWGETPTLLLGKAKALEELGQHEAALALLPQAESQLDREREPRNLFVVRSLQLFNLCHLGRYAEAEMALADQRALATRLGNQLDLLRVDWGQGKVAAGLGRSGEAIDALGRVRAAFMAQGNAYDTALVTLELAEIHAALGHTSEVKALAQASAPIFRAQGVHREAQRALELFRRAASEERVSAELVRGLITYLYRSRHDARARFQQAT
jgi:tetratricopeptide (TPR) repeat protein/transcriptional regulator with XRE-family HTH domain